MKKPPPWVWVAGGIGVVGTVYYFFHHPASTARTTAASAVPAAGIMAAAPSSYYYNGMISPSYDPGVQSANPIAPSPAQGASAGTTMPTTTPIPPTNTLTAPTVTATPSGNTLPVDTATNNVAYNSQTGGSYQLGPTANAPFANLPPGWSVRTIDSGMPQTGGGTLPAGQYAIPPGAPENPTLDGPTYTTYHIPSGWQFLSSAT